MWLWFGYTGIKLCGQVNAPFDVSMIVSACPPLCEWGANVLEASALAVCEFEGVPTFNRKVHLF